MAAKLIVTSSHMEGGVAPGGTVQVAIALGLNHEPQGLHSLVQGDEQGVPKNADIPQNHSLLCFFFDYLFSFSLEDGCPPFYSVHAGRCVAFASI